MRILIIEDEPGVSLMMVHLLTRAGCAVSVAWDATHGMELAHTEDFDLITLDMDLPDLTGYELCWRLKADARSQHTPIVFVSGRLADEDARHGFALGALDYITKPFDPADFIFRFLSHAKSKIRPTSGSPPMEATA